MRRGNAKPYTCESVAIQAPDGPESDESQPMAIDDSPSSFFSPWPDRLRHSAIFLLACGIVLAVLASFGELPPLCAAAVFGCIAAAALVPWRLHNGAVSREDIRRVNPVETA